MSELQTFSLVEVEGRYHKLLSGCFLIPQTKQKRKRKLCQILYCVRDSALLSCLWFMYSDKKRNFPPPPPPEHWAYTMYFFLIGSKAYGFICLLYICTGFWIFTTGITESMFHGKSLFVTSY